MSPVSPPTSVSVLIRSETTADWSQSGPVQTVQAASDHVTGLNVFEIRLHQSPPLPVT